MGTKEAQTVAQQIKAGVSEDLYHDLTSYNNFFNQKKDEKATELATTVNDTYIKSQGDDRGVAYYGAV